MLKIFLSIILVFGLPFFAWADGSSQVLINYFEGNAPNQYKQVITSASANNTTTTVYTVDSGHTFYLTSFSCTGGTNATSTAVSAQCEVTNNSGTFQYYISQVATNTQSSNAGQNSDSRNLFYAIQVPSGYIFKIIAPASATGAFNIAGFEI